MIIPAIIPNSLPYLKEGLKKTSFSKVVQIDLVDGKFVPFVSWPYDPVGAVKDIKEVITDREVEIDLMVENPVIALKEWVEVGVKRVIFHLEGLSKPEQAIQIAQEHSVKVFFSINNDTELDALYPYVDKLDGVQLMGIAEIGSQGQPFDNRVLERVATLHALYPNLTISVDGGVSEETILNLQKVGVSNFVSGSAILKSNNPQEAYEKLLKIIS